LDEFIAGFVISWGTTWREGLIDHFLSELNSEAMGAVEFASAR